MHLHHHEHQHGEPGSHRKANRRRLAITLALSASYMFAEVIGGLMTNSLALLADAGHMLSDVAALSLSLFAIWIADRPSPPHRTFGYYRTEILAALVNGTTLVVISVFIMIEAFRRFQQPPDVHGELMMVIAVIGLMVNLVGLGLLHRGRDESLNVRGAWLHILTDALGSVGAIVAAMLIWAFGWYWSDPLASVAIAVLIVYSAWRLLAEAVSVLMESAPRGIDVDEVHNAMLATPSVLSVHDLHIWSITTGLDSLSAHVVADECDQTVLLGDIRAMLHDRFGIDHITIQIEPEDFEEPTSAFRR